MLVKYSYVTFIGQASPDSTICKFIGENIALKKPAYSSVTTPFSPSRAVDGNWYGTQFYKDNGPKMWWAVDLGKE